MVVAPLPFLSQLQNLFTCVVMLILILSMFNIYRMLFLALKKVWMAEITPLRIFTTRWKNPYPHQNFPSPQLGGVISPYLFNAIWKALACFTWPSRGVEMISTYFSVWLWIATQFSTPKTVMSLKVFLLIENGFLISTWKYWIWISKNKSILRITAWKGCWLLFYPKFCVGVLLCFSLENTDYFTSLLIEDKSLSFWRQHWPK